MLNARAATLHGSGMTATKSGGSMTALTMAPLVTMKAGGAGMSRTKDTTGMATRAKVTTGSKKPTILKGAAVTGSEQHVALTAHLAAQTTCASYLASAIRPSVERTRRGTIHSLNVIMHLLFSFHFL